MMSVKEKILLQSMLNTLDHQEIVNHYQPQKKRTNRIDVSSRLRDQQGRFLPYDHPVEELHWIYDNNEEVDLQRTFKVTAIPGSYNSYSIDDKMKRDWSGNIYLLCFLGILIISYIS
ncbi:hypothetical protein Q9R38_26985 [Priestia aryabhattai]|uniref:hypothetical protein n=1 Tax=Priestia aryabhattai TaxID=412384 RepID=UPI0028826756|nr:hypothetical protein [Priestia aryabhattai]MDT0150180.1 hypothetical protein [Priestia aryabhattai]MDT0155750.1 hypothetical protein [Priestia aryabhattai]